MLTAAIATDQASWDTFISTQRFRPFLQTWTMGEVCNQVGVKPIRIQVTDDKGEIVGICQATVVPARRGRHLAASYGPLVADAAAYPLIVAELTKAATEHNCDFLRLAPFVPKTEEDAFLSQLPNKSAAPMHLLAEDVWYLPLTEPNAWQTPITHHRSPITSEEFRKNLRKTTRNLIGRAERDGVTIERSTNPVADIEGFIGLHEETRKRHKFVPYSNNFFRAQVELFHPRGECTMYRAMYQGELIACSVHMHTYGETSYHHGASTHKYSKIPASYLLQWTAINDALERGDHAYSFWGIAPVQQMENGKWKMENSSKKHPFAGVTTFKMGYGGELLQLTHCADVPLNKKYYLTKGFETFRKWKRGF